MVTMLFWYILKQTMQLWLVHEMYHKNLVFSRCQEYKCYFYMVEKIIHFPFSSSFHIWKKKKMQKQDMIADIVKTNTWELSRYLHRCIDRWVYCSRCLAMFLHVNLATPPWLSHVHLASLEKMLMDERTKGSGEDRHVCLMFLVDVFVCVCVSVIVRDRALIGIG